jgi:hypothetical protein
MKKLPAINAQPLAAVPVIGAHQKVIAKDRELTGVQRTPGDQIEVSHVVLARVTPTGARIDSAERY